MSIERTRKVMTSRGERDPQHFFSQYRVSVILASGPSAGNEYFLKWDRVTLGRGPGVDLAFDDASMSREHALLELWEDTFRIRDLGSTNGVLVNGSPVQVAELKHGDRFALGELIFQYTQEKVEQSRRS